MVTAVLPARRNVIGGAAAAGWVIGGRLIGLGWTALLVARLDVADYGVYAIAFAVAAIVAVPVDNLFHVRAVRVDDDAFRHERAGRALTGIVIALVGAALFAPSLIAGFALVVAGGEIAFNALKSGSLRAGRPQRTTAWDLARQVASIALGGIALLASAHPQLGTATALYAAPYAAVLVLAAVRCLRVRPRIGGTWRERGLLALEALGLGAYLQGDVVVVGLVAGSATAGLYSLGSLVALAAASLSQVFAQTYTDDLRRHGGAPDAGPSRASMAGVALVLGAGVAALAGIAAVVPAGRELAAVLAVMALFAALRSGSTMLTSLLYAQHRDGHRVAASCAAAVVKVGALCLLAPAGGAVVAAVVVTLVEVGVLAWFAAVALRAPGDTAPLPITPKGVRS
jgi:O-antigen/teichoic acid export membrane protein